MEASEALHYVALIDPLRWAELHCQWGGDSADSIGSCGALHSNAAEEKYNGAALRVVGWQCRLLIGTIEDIIYNHI